MNTAENHSEESELQNFGEIFASIPKEKLQLQVPVIASPLVWLAIVGNLQLALRHPANTGASTPHVRQFAAQVLRHLEIECGLSKELIDRAFADFSNEAIQDDLPKGGERGD